MYLAPALSLARHLQSPCSIGQIYDSVIQLGQSATQELISSCPFASTSSDQSAEPQWTSSFLAARTARLQSMGPVYAATITRINSYAYVLKNNQESDWQKGQITALDNDGNVVALKCDPAFKMPVFSLQSSYPLGGPNAQSYSSAETVLEVIRRAVFWHCVFLLLFVDLY